MRNGFPEHWSVASFKEVADVVTGTTPSTKHPEYYGDEIPFIGPSELGSSIPITSSTKWLSNEGGKEARLLPNESVLVCCIGATIGKVGFAGTGLATNQQINALVFDQTQVFPRYGFYYCQTLEKLIRHQGASTTLPLLPKSRFQKLEIPLPPIEEQRRIAAVLDKADAVRRKQKEAIALTEELLRSVFLEMFGDPVTNPREWEVWSMKELIKKISTGWSAGGEDEPLGEGEWGVLKISAVTTGNFIPTEFKNVGKPPFKKPTIVPKRGDLLFTRANTRELVAATCLVESDHERIFLPDKIWSIETREGIVTREYLRFLLAEPKYRRLLTRKATGTSGSMLNVSQKKLLEMSAPVPPIDLQRHFSDFVWKNLGLRDKYRLAVDHSEDEFNSLLQRAFRGEL